MSERNEPVSDREIVVERRFDAPREVVYEAWTKPEHLASWWGPRGCTVTTHAFELAPGAVWRFTMHGPDGTDYPNLITYEEIVPGERLVYTTRAGDDGPVLFRSTVSFASDGEQTHVRMQGVFPSAAARDEVVKRHGAIEGGKQTLNRLSGYLAARQRRYRLELTRVFDAPRHLVFAAWSKAEHVQQWFPPEGFGMPECSLDFRPGGVFRFLFTGPNGEAYPFDGSFREIVPDQRIVFEGTIHDGLEAVTTVRFEEANGKTTLYVEQVYSTQSEATRGAPIGWGQTLDHLAAFVAGGS